MCDHTAQYQEIRNELAEIKTSLAVLAAEKKAQNGRLEKAEESMDGLFTRQREVEERAYTLITNEAKDLQRAVQDLVESAKLAKVARGDGVQLTGKQILVGAIALILLTAFMLEAGVKVGDLLSGGGSIFF